MKLGGMCFNWKVLAGLAVVGLGVWVVAPNLAAAALPLLILAACPLSMLIMGCGMQAGQCSTEPRQMSRPTDMRLTREEQLTELKAQLSILEIRRQALGREIAQLEAADTAAVRGAEVVADGLHDRTERQG